MKAFLSFLLLLGFIPISIYTMIHGWGLSPANWGWLAFGYTWSIVLPGIVGLMKD